jgi:hypothetical protein
VSFMSFTAPWLLLGLIALPVVWWLARAVPTAPRRQSFPAIAILKTVSEDEETPARTPWWLAALRMLAVALLVIGFAGPVQGPQAGPTDTRPLLIVIDNGWPLAPRWRDVIAEADGATRTAGGPVRLLLTGERRVALSEPLTPAQARAALIDARPQPWLPDAVAATRAVADLPAGQRILWMSDGLARPGAAQLASAIARLGDATLRTPGPGEGPVALVSARRSADAVVALMAIGPQAPDAVRVRLTTDDGRLFGETLARLPAGAARAEASVRIEGPPPREPLLVRLSGIDSAGAVLLPDGATGRLRVGVASDARETSPLVSDRFYVERALNDGADVVVAPPGRLAQANVDALVMTDRGRLPAADERDIGAWVEAGGVLIRFAGPRLAERSAGDRLLPGALRDGARRLGGAVGWDRPVTLGAPEPAGPLADLSPPVDAVVRAHVMLDEARSGDVQVWQRLADGAPLVTAAQRGRGYLVLIHTGAGPDWSDLPFTGWYVGLLDRLSALAATGLRTGVADPSGGPMAPKRLIDGFGRLSEAEQTGAAIPVAAFAATRAGRDHPPGLYANDWDARALNAGPGAGDLKAGPPPPAGIARALAPADAPAAFGGWLIVAGLLLLALDALAALWTAGRLGSGVMRPAATALGLMLLAGAALISPMPAHAQAPNALERTARDVRIGYVVTGDAASDARARDGLRGLVNIVLARTAVAAGPPAPVRLATDELAVYPLLYWRIAPRGPALSEQEARRLSAFLATGGMLFIDTGAIAGDPARLRAALGDLSLPPLQPAGADHVLGKTFYLLRGWPGQAGPARLFVETAASAAGNADGVSSVLVGDGDWASAWAVDATNRPLAPVTGGERQRELAYRVGVNVVLYALTGNYKTDQVHAGAVLERLGRR